MNLFLVYSVHATLTIYMQNMKTNKDTTKYVF